MQDLAAEVVAKLHSGRPLPGAGAPSPHEHPVCSAASRSLGPSGIDAVLHKCILGVLGMVPPPHQPLMEVRKDGHMAVACVRPRATGRPAAPARGRLGWTRWEPWSCAARSALPLVWTWLPRSHLTTQPWLPWPPTSLPPPRQAHPGQPRPWCWLSEALLLPDAPLQCKSAHLK
jgi:hypothetical protein